MDLLANTCLLTISETPIPKSYFIHYMWRLASTGLLYFSKCPEPSASKGSALTRLAPFFSMAGSVASILRIKNPLCTKQSILLALEMAFGEKDGGGADHWSISQNDKKRLSKDSSHECFWWRASAVRPSRPIPAQVRGSNPTQGVLSGCVLRLKQIFLQQYQK